MKKYSLSARIFLYGVVVLGALSAFAALTLPRAGRLEPAPWMLVLALGLALLAGSRKVSLIRSPRFTEHCCVSLGFVITIFCLLAFGTRACVGAGVASAVGACIYPRRLPWHQIAFNVSSVTSAAAGAALTYRFLELSAVDWVHAPLLVTLSVASVYFAINSGCLAAVISLTSDRLWIEVWRSLLWTGPSYFAGASLALLAQLWTGANAALFLTIPILIFVQQFYRTHVEKLDQTRQRLEQQERYIEELQQSRQMLSDLYASTVHSFATAIDAKDQGTHVHIQRVQKLAVGIAQILKVEGDQLEAVRTGALLHDIGKLGVPDSILLKMGPLSEEEYALMKRHPDIGAEILEPVRFPWPVLDVVRHHHERWDGRGYPGGLAGLDIPLSARIMTVADVYDALTSDRPYRDAWSAERAQTYMREQAGVQFDAGIVEALLRYCESSGEIAPAQAVAEHPAKVRVTAINAEWERGSHAGLAFDIAHLLADRRPGSDRLQHVCQRIAEAIPGSECALAVVGHSDCGADPKDAGESAEAPAPTVAVRVLAASKGSEHEVWRSRILSMRPRSLDGTGRTDGGEKTGAEPDTSLLVAEVVATYDGAIALYMANPHQPTSGEGARRILQVGASLILNDLIDCGATECSDGASDETKPVARDMRFLAALTQKRSLGSIEAWLTPIWTALAIGVAWADAGDSSGAGREISAHVAMVIERSLAESGTLVRVTDSDLVAILPGIAGVEAREIGARVRDAVQDAYPGSLECYFGTASSSDTGGAMRDLILDAERRMNLARGASGLGFIAATHAVVSAAADLLLTDAREGPP